MGLFEIVIATDVAAAKARGLGDAFVTLGEGTLADYLNRLLADFPRLWAALYADTLLTRFLSALGFLFSLLPF